MLAALRRRTSALLPALLPALLLILLIPLAVAASDAGATSTAAPTAATASTDAGWLASVWALIVSGGWTMIPIFLAMLAGLTFAGERFLATRRPLIDPPQFEEKLLQTLTVLGADDALKLCDQNATVLSRVVANAIKRYKFDLATIREAVIDQCARENLRLKGPLRVVGLMGQVLPMLGLFGTVVGMIQAFRTIGHSTNGVTDYAHLGESISVALVTTLFGLLFAIPLLLLYYFLKGRIDRAIQRVENTASTLIDDILLREVHHMRLEKDLQATVETREMPVASLVEQVDLSDEFAEEGSFKSSVTTPANPASPASPAGSNTESDPAGSSALGRGVSASISQHITSANISGIGRHAITPADPMVKKPRGPGDSAKIPSPEQLPEQSPEERIDNLDNLTKGPKLRKPE